MIVVPAWLWKTVWSNFEIADMDFWRGKAYSAFFEYLDRYGSFYYEVLSPFPNTPTLNLN
jgi:Glycolipid 2-alpha-mannosyltransferase